MQTTLEIDQELLQQAMHDSGKTTGDAAVEAGLRLLIQTRAQAGMRKLRVVLAWDGDLDQTRRSRIDD